jgi:hypothetical protein
MRDQQPFREAVLTWLLSFLTAKKTTTALTIKTVAGYGVGPLLWMGKDDLATHTS